MMELIPAWKNVLLFIMIRDAGISMNNQRRYPDSLGNSPVVPFQDKYGFEPQDGRTWASMIKT